MIHNTTAVSRRIRYWPALLGAFLLVSCVATPANSPSATSTPKSTPTGAGVPALDAFYAHPGPEGGSPLAPSNRT